MSRLSFHQPGDHPHDSTYKIINVLNLLQDFLVPFEVPVERICLGRRGAEGLCLILELIENTLTDINEEAKK